MAYLCYLQSFEVAGHLILEVDPIRMEQFLQLLEDPFYETIWEKRSIELKVGGQNCYLYYNVNGRYFRFLQEMALEDLYANQYTQQYLRIEDFSPYFVFKGVIDQMNLDYADESIQLMTAIHYLSVLKRNNQ